MFSVHAKIQNNQLQLRYNILLYTAKQALAEIWPNYRITYRVAFTCCIKYVQIKEYCTTSLPICTAQTLAKIWPYHQVPYSAACTCCMKYAQITEYLQVCRYLNVKHKRLHKSDLITEYRTVPPVLAAWNMSKSPNTTTLSTVYVQHKACINLT